MNVCDEGVTKKQMFHLVSCMNVCGEGVTKKQVFHFAEVILVVFLQGWFC